jgi:hypothetical protein
MIKRFFCRLGNYCNSIAMDIIFVPTILLERCGNFAHLVIDQSYLWAAMIVCSPITLAISLPFWVLGSLFCWFGGQRSLHVL